MTNLQIVKDFYIIYFAMIPKSKSVLTLSCYLILSTHPRTLKPSSVSSHNTAPAAKGQNGGQENGGQENGGQESGGQENGEQESAAAGINTIKGFK